MKIYSKLIAVFVVLLVDWSYCTGDESSEIFNDTSTPPASPQPASTFYTAAVVEMNPPGRYFEDAQENVEANLAEFVGFIEKAGEKGVDIIVFSEAALNYEGITSRQNLSLFAVDLQEKEIPDISDCDYSHDLILNGISVAAANASVYVLVNVVESEVCNETDSCSDDIKLYNTNLVFDRRGCIVSRYRKFNLFVEPLMNVTETADISTFETDFGVIFGHFVCFDILFESPAMELMRKDVKHILYPSMWFSETPFLTSVQIQQSFAQANNIVLLSAGTNSPYNSNTGSGIFVGKHGAIEKLISCKNESIMMIAEVPKDVDDLEYVPPDSEVILCSSSEIEALKLWRFQPKSSHPLQNEFISTVDDVTCHISLNYTKLETESKAGFRVILFSGTRNYAGIVNAGEIHCAVVACVDESNEETCGDKLDKTVDFINFHSISIKLTIDNGNSDDYLVMPTSLDTLILPFKTESYIFESEITDEKQTFSIKSSQNLGNFLTFGIFGRNFALDNKEIKTTDKRNASDHEELEKEKSNQKTKNDDDNSLSLKMTIYVILMVVLSIITAVMTYRKLQHPYVKPDLNKRRRSSMHY